MAILMEISRKNIRSSALINLLNRIIQAQHGVQLPVVQLYFLSINSWIIIAVLPVKSTIAYHVNASIIPEWLALNIESTTPLIATINSFLSLFRVQNTNSAQSVNIGLKEWMVAQQCLANVDNNFAMIAVELSALTVHVLTWEFALCLLSRLHGLSEVPNQKENDYSTFLLCTLLIEVFYCWVYIIFEYEIKKILVKILPTWHSSVVYTQQRRGINQINWSAQSFLTVCQVIARTDVDELVEEIAHEEPIITENKKPQLKTLI